MSLLTPDSAARGATPANPLALVRAAVGAHPQGIQGVADELEYSRPALSRYVNGSYGNADKLEAAIRARYDRRDCPHTGDAVAREVCQRRALVPRPFGGHARARQWDACQTCIHKPASEIAK